MRKILLVVPLVMLAACFLAGCGKEEPKELIRPLRAIKVSDPHVLSLRAFPGRAKATEEVDLSFRVSGPLVSRPISVGDKVKKGQLIARIDPRDFEVRLREAQGRLARAQANVTRAESDYRRIKRIRERDPGAASEAMLDKAIEVRDSAQANVLSLKADVDAASDALSYTYLKAPYAGTIVRTFVENFETVQAKQPIARLLDISKIEMVIDLPENLIKYATDPDASLKITVHFDPFPGHEFPAKIEEVGKEASEITRTFPVNLIMNQPPDFQILPGMAGTATGTVKLSPDDPEAGIRVPSTSIFSPPGKGGSFVWVIDPDTKKVSRRPVQLGKITNTGTLIRKGLKPGEWVAIAGVHHLKEGQQVSLQDETPKETPL